MNNKKNDNELSITKLKVSKITSNHSDAQSKLRSILLKKKAAEKIVINDSDDLTI